MSMLYDISRTVKDFGSTHNINNADVTNLLINIVGDLEWNSFDFDNQGDYEEEVRMEYERAYEYLYGNDNAK